MKIKNQKDVEQLQDTISRELGIDISKYQDESVAENLVDLLIFPKYIAKWVARPLILALLLYIIGFFIVDLVHIQYIIYGLVGFLLFFLVGVFSGVLFLTKKMNEDLSNISEYSLGIMKNSLSDIDGLGDRITPSNRKDVMGLLFNGIIHVVTIPMIGNAIDKKVPVGSKLVKGLVKNSLIAMSNKLDFDEDNIDENAVVDESDSNVVQGLVSAIDKASNGISGTLGVVTKVIRVPFKLGFYLCAGLLIMFLYLIW